MMHINMFHTLIPQDAAWPPRQRFGAKEKVTPADVLNKMKTLERYVVELKGNAPLTKGVESGRYVIAKLSDTAFYVGKNSDQKIKYNDEWYFAKEFIGLSDFHPASSDATSGKTDDEIKAWVGNLYNKRAAEDLEATYSVLLEKLNKTLDK